MASHWSALTLESVVAWLFGLSALAALAMTTWAYVYQTIHRHRARVEPVQSKTEGHFFRRIVPSRR